MRKNYELIIRFFCLLLFSCYAGAYVSKLSYNFVIKWPVSKEDFEKVNSRTSDPYGRARVQSGESSEEKDCLRKTKFDFAGVGNLTFSLCLLERSGYYVVLKPETSGLKVTDTLILEYAYVASPHRIYSLSRYSRYDLPFKTTELTRSIIGNENSRLFSKGVTTIYCHMHVKALVKSTVLTDNNLRFNTYVPLNSSEVFKLCSYDEYRSWRDYSKCRYVDDFALGKMPDFNVTLAKDMLLYSMGSRLERWKIPELTALSVEYLIDHMTCDNVSSLLKIAVERVIFVLRDECISFITKKCKIQNV